MSLHSLLMFCAPMTMACGATLGWPLEKMLSDLQSYNATICGSNGCIQWMTKKKLGTTPLQSKLMLSFSILRIESAEPKCEELAVLSSSYHLSQAAASAFSLPSRHSPAASPPHIPLPRHKLDLFIYVCFSIPFATWAKTSEKYGQVGRFKHQRLLSSLKCPASRACASNAAFLERQLHATKTACPNAVRAFVSYIMFSLQHFLSQQVPQLCASS